MSQLAQSNLFERKTAETSLIGLTCDVMGCGVGEVRCKIVGLSKADRLRHRHTRGLDM